MKQTILAIVLATSWAYAATTIDDPVKFVKWIYTLKDKPPPDDIYTPRLQELFALEKREAGGEVGRMDFDFWRNAQDSAIGDLKVSSQPVEKAPARQVVIATFKNMGKSQEIHFYFERTKAGWKLDDARSLKGEQWTLSLILKYGWDGKP